MLGAQAILATQVSCRLSNLPLRPSSVPWCLRLPCLYKAGFPHTDLVFPQVSCIRPNLSRECRDCCSAHPNYVVGLPSLMCVLGSRTVLPSFSSRVSTQGNSLPLIYLGFLPWCVHGTKAVPTCRIELG